MSSHETTEDVSVSELFHENSKHHRSDRAVVDRIMAALGSPVLQGIMATAFKQYPSARKIPLSREFPPAAATFDEAVLSRRSLHQFGTEPLGWAQFCKLVQFAGGVTGTGDLPYGERQYFRAAPSGGGLYPIEMYVFALRVETLTPGLYHYYPVDNRIELLSERDYSAELKTVTFASEVAQAGAVFALTGIPLKSRLKYGERGYRFMLLEAGHIAQNLLLTANSLRLAAFPIGGFIDDELDRLLRTDGRDEISLYLVAVGRT